MSMVLKESSLNPQQSSAHTEEEPAHGIRAGQDVSALFPPRGQAGPGTLHSELVDKSAPRWGSSVPFTLHFKSGHLPQQKVVSGGCRGAVGRVSFQGHQPGGAS